MGVRNTEGRNKGCCGRLERGKVRGKVEGKGTMKGGDQRGMFSDAERKF